VIFEYKRSTNENVISQGLFYLDWLLDHRAEFDRLVSSRLEQVGPVDWSSPRLVCVAKGFTRYDEYAVRQINRSIDLVRYRDFQGELLALELVTAVTGMVKVDETPSQPRSQATSAASKATDYKTVTQVLDQSPISLRDLYGSLESFVLSLGDDVQKKVTKTYIAFKRLKNIVCVEIHAHELLVFLKVPPASVTLEDGFSRDVSAVGHFGTGDLELRLRTPADLVRAQPLIQRSYESS